MTTNRWVSVFLALCAAACSGPEQKPDEAPAAQGDVLAECKAQAEAASRQADAFASPPTGSRMVMEAAYTEFQRTVDAWEAEDAPCAREGAAVTDRMQIQAETSRKLADAEARGTAAIVRFLEPNTDEARELLKTIFARGRKQNDAVIDAATAIDRNYRQRLLGYFRETKKYGQLDAQMKTTCVFSDTSIDPNTGEITDNFRSVFRGKLDVHALCRIPLPADKFAGDPDGKIVLVLDDDADPSNGVLHEGDLGSPEKWGTTQWFSGRFGIPQGPASAKESGYYYVWLKAVRPAMGDETLVHNWFYWYR